MNKPITVTIEETGQKITKVLVDSALPAWVLRDVVKDIYEQLASLALTQAQNEKKAWAEHLAKEEGSEEEEGAEE